MRIIYTLSFFWAEEREKREARRLAGIPQKKFKRPATVIPFRRPARKALGATSAGTQGEGDLS